MSNTHQSGILFLICAPSGAGKTTLVQKALHDLQDLPIYKVCTYTTKPMGKGEVEGKDYHFLTVLEFERLIQEGFFLEWSQGYEHYYGSPASIKEGLARGESYLLIVDRAGVRSITQRVPESLSIWVDVSSIDLLKKRLFARDRENNAIILKRLEIAEKEMQEEAQNPLCIYHIINDDIEIAVQDLATFVRQKLKK
jgi:guanylate kinase